MAKRRKRPDEEKEQLSLWGAPESDRDEQIRRDSQEPLGEDRPGPLRGDRGSGDVLRRPGEQAESQVQQLAATLAGPDQPGEEYLQKVGRLNMARLQAEEAVLAELVWIPQPGEESEEPATDWVTQTMRAIHEADPDNEPPED